MFGNLLEFLEKVSIITSVFLAITKRLPGLLPGLGVKELFVSISGPCTLEKK